MEMDLENFPDDVLLEIFKRLRHKDLLTLMCSCKRFHNLILSSSMLMRRIPLIVVCNSEPKNIDVIVKSQRKYQKLKIVNFSDENFEFIFKLFEIYANYVTHVTFMRANMSGDKFRELIGLIKEIRVLELDQVYFTNSCYSPITHVRTLKIFSCSREMFNMVNFQNLYCLEANYTPFQLYHWDCFLKNNPMIRKLVIRCTFGIDLSDDVVDTITKNLRDLEHFEILDKYVKVNNDVYKIICDNCPNLKYLKLWNINIEKNFTDIDKNYVKSKGIKCDLFNDVSLNGQCFQIM